MPVKRFLEERGFTVKGEIDGCDLVATKGDLPIVVVGELKLRFNLELVLQGVDRARSCDEVWLAARIAKRAGRGRESDSRYRQLCRRLGFGMLGVDDAGGVSVLVGPDAPFPRRDPKRRARLVKEHDRRVGDPAVGGGSRQPIMTAYRQQALACATGLVAGPRSPRELRDGAPDAAKILLRNVYGWFERLGRGRYGLTEAGRLALLRWPQA